MSYSNYLVKMEYLIHLLKQENTGTADCLAKKMSISRRTLFRFLDELKLRGANIKYSKIKRSYFFANDFNFTENILQGAIKWHSPRLTLEKTEYIT